MAVVQISKIQVRRGTALIGGGVPQLSSAEFAWAVDTQQLFIGNGSVAEGAPYVGNTQVLTEHDNILELASSYRFSSTDPSITLSLPRSLQDKLDETVSVIDFGAVGDGVTDCLEAFQNAFIDLFQNPNTAFNKTLLIPNGVYVFSGNLNIPSTAIIRGETQAEAVLKIDSNNILFVTETGLGVGEFDSSIRPVNISISNLTIQRTTGQLVLTGIANSVLDGVKFKSNYALSTPIVGNIEDSTAAVYWENSLPGTRVTGIEIKNCVFEATALAVRSDQITVDIGNPPNYDTYVKFDNCKFFVCHTGIVINGITAQGNKWQINDCEFEEIYQYAFKSDYGYGTLIQRSQFINCGNEDNTAATPVVHYVYFGESFGNAVLDCSSNRHQVGAITALTTVGAVGEVFNSSKASFVNQNYSDISLSDSFRTLAVFDATSKYTYIEYSLRLGVHTRRGQLAITIDDDFEHASITDNYSYSPELQTSPGGTRMTSFQFSVELKDNDADSGIETLVLSYMNPLSTGTTGTISYTVSYGV
jgi:hypothetical protein